MGLLFNNNLLPKRHPEHLNSIFHMLGTCPKFKPQHGKCFVDPGMFPDDCEEIKAVERFSMAEKVLLGVAGKPTQVLGETVSFPLDSISVQGPCCSLNWACLFLLPTQMLHLR